MKREQADIARTLQGNPDLKILMLEIMTLTPHQQAEAVKIITEYLKPHNGTIS